MHAVQMVSATKSLARTGLLLMGRSSDVRRWRDDRELNPQWFSRSIAAANYIEPGTSVVEFGAGAGRLRELLPSDCRYQPTDLVRRGPDYFVVDLNTEQPLPRAFDVAVLLGVIEYVHDPERLFRRLRAVAGRLVVSYCVAGPDSNKVTRRARGWVNDLSEERLRALCEGGGFRVESAEELELGQHQLLFSCRATG